MRKNMKFKLLPFFLIATFVPVLSANADSGYDVEDPMYLTPSKDFLSSSNGYFSDSLMRLSQKFSYGINGIMSFDADIKYQQDFNHDDDGFSNVGLGVVYRLSGDSEIISDALFNINFQRSSKVPEFSHTVYSTGFRVGRKWSWVTLAGTIKTTWIFDDVDGIAYIDLMPEAYFRFNEFWSAGFGFDYRKATDPEFDNKILNFKLVRTYGRTQYAANVGYEFESKDYTFGGRINIVF